MNDPTPIGTEGLQGFDFDGVPSHDACDPRNDTTVVVAPGPLLDPKPRVLQREASDTGYMAPETIRARFADRLREAGYQEPVLPRRCAVDGCDSWTHQVICQDCEIEQGALAQAAEDHRTIPWAAVLKWSLILGAVVGAVTWAVL